MKMRRSLYLIAVIAITLVTFSCKNESKKEEQTKNTIEEEFNWTVDTFADVRILNYKIPGFEKLNLKQKKLVYYLTQAGYEGRDIMYDQNYRYNLDIRNALDNIYKNYKGDKSDGNWESFVLYLKRIWFSNGIHHHYSNDKFIPGFTREYFNTLLNETKTQLDENIVEVIFDPKIDNKKISLDATKDLLLNSAVNFYAPDVSQTEVEEFYANKIDKSDDKPISYGLNSRIFKDKYGKIQEDVYKVGGLYGSAIEEMVYWLEKAKMVAGNDNQKKGLELLIDYYKTGDLKIWDEYNVHWVQNTDVDIDYINSFIEVYNDPLGYRGSYENIIEIKDFEASERMKILGENAQWFEDNSPIMDEHKKENVVGITYKVVNVAGESGDASPATPLGVNLPNSNWIRSKYGSKSVSLGNIIESYFNASGGGGLLTEFGNSQEEIELEKKYGNLADKLTTALHEVIGHASGKLNEGVGTPKETLKNYASTLEEARADIVALYFIMDSFMIKLGMMSDLDVGKAAYDGYISNGLLKQLIRIESGKDIEQAHMRNRQLICNWALEKGAKEKIIEKYTKEGKTYFKINDYQKLRMLFGNLMVIIQRIKSEGDYEAGKQLVETYGVKVDKAIHKEVLERVEKFNIKPYSGFVNPYLVPVKDKDGNIINVKIEYPETFEDQMIYYGETYNNLK